MRGGTYRINIEGLDEKLIELAIKKLEPKVRQYLMDVFAQESHSIRKFGRNCCRTQRALEERKNKIGPNQYSIMSLALQNFSLNKTPESEKLSEYVRKMNPELHKQKRV